LGIRRTWGAFVSRADLATAIRSISREHFAAKTSFGANAWHTGLYKNAASLISAVLVTRCRAGGDLYLTLRTLNFFLATLNLPSAQPVMICDTLEVTFISQEKKMSIEHFNTVA